MSDWLSLKRLLSAHREERSLDDPQEQAADDETLEVVDNGGEGRDDAPQRRAQANVDSRVLDFGDDHVAGDLKADIPREEDRHACLQGWRAVRSDGVAGVLPPT